MPDEYAVHSLHAPAVKLPFTHDGKTVIQLPAPLHVAATMEEAEAWRAAADAVRAGFDLPDEAAPEGERA